MTGDWRIETHDYKTVDDIANRARNKILEYISKTKACNEYLAEKLNMTPTAVKLLLKRDFWEIKDCLCIALKLGLSVIFVIHDW